jgi:mono/diheme cytochrome c family protein
MRSREDYTRLLAVAIVLSFGVLIAFQIYIVREPDRIQSVLAADQASQVAHGQELYTANCVECHGKQGEGDIGPALNARKLLKSADDATLFSIIGTGVPGTAMPSWSQVHGGPFTDEQISDLVAFIRHWEPTATDIGKPTPTPNPASGAAIFNSTCYACHGINGQGTNIAPALNSPDLLSKFDDKWFKDTITKGRPAKGMPTWGRVLSPQQVDAVVAYIRAWQTKPPANTNIPAGGDPANGAVIYANTCIVCHGAAGTGTDRAPTLTSDAVRSRSGADLFTTISAGRLDKGMPAWGHVFSPAQIGDLVAYLKSLK